VFSLPPAVLAIAGDQRRAFSPPFKAQPAPALNAYCNDGRQRPAYPNPLCQRGGALIEVSFFRSGRARRVGDERLRVVR
jgi:hypothetical protein